MFCMFSLGCHKTKLRQMFRQMSFLVTKTYRKFIKKNYYLGPKITNWVQ